MNILITCTTLAHGGAQSVARSLVGGLKNLGHSAIAYSNEPEPREPALLGESATSDLDHLPFRPDIIHGQHHLDTMTALTAFPDVPAIYQVHGALWKDCVLKHPRVYRYLAVARTAAHRMAVESKILPDDIEILLNSVELARFTKVRLLPAEPKRVLFFNRHHRADSETVSAVREAVARRGLKLDCIGYYFGRLIDAAEDVLPSYDIVFASGISAIEALACGCAVIVLGRTSCGEMVQPENFEKFREANFSLANNSPPPSVAQIENQLLRYSPQSCASVTGRLRDEADFGKSITRLMQIYERVIAQHRGRPSDMRAESLAASRYLRRIVPLVRKADEMVGESVAFMKVLITNNTLQERGGAESFVRCLARGLENLGHSVLAYSSDASQGERLLENDVMAVATDLENLPFLPDVIHAQHHLDAMTALAALPGVPAIYHSHGAVWRGCVVKHPRIYKYLAMSQTYAQRIATESNIAAQDIEVFLNGVDLTHFRKVRKLPAQPKRALFYNSRHDANSKTISVIREAASKRSLELDCIGYAFGDLIGEPEKVLSTYDIVFASGVSAIEALASGCAVIVLGRTSCGEMVQPENFQRYRQTNFSIATNSPPAAVEKIEAEIARYSPERSASVTEQLREEADFGKLVARLVQTYERVIAQHRTRPPDLPAEILAMSQYLRRIVPLIKTTDNMLGRNWSSASRATTFDELSARVALLEKIEETRVVDAQLLDTAAIY